MTQLKSARPLVPAAVHEASSFEKMMVALGKQPVNWLQVPTMTEEFRYWRLVATVVTIDQSDKELVYWNKEGRGFALKKQALAWLASACGVAIGPATTTYRADDNSPTVTVLLRWQDYPGHYRTVPGTYCYDITARMNELSLAAEHKDTEEGRAQALANLPGLYARESRFATRKAETGAILAGLRFLLGIKHTYSADELKRPFVAIRVEWTTRGDVTLERALHVQAQQDIADIWDDPEEAPDPELQAAARTLLQAASHPTVCRPQWPRFGAPDTTEG